MMITRRVCPRCGTEYDVLAGVPARCPLDDQPLIVARRHLERRPRQ